MTKEQVKLLAEAMQLCRNLGKDDREGDRYGLGQFQAAANSADVAIFNVLNIAHAYLHDPEAIAFLKPQVAA